MIGPAPAELETSLVSIIGIDKGNSSGGRIVGMKSGSKSTAKAKTKSKSPPSAKCQLYGCPSTQVHHKKKKKTTTCRQPDGTIEGAEEADEDDEKDENEDDDDNDDDDELRNCSSHAWRRTTTRVIKVGEVRLSFGAALVFGLSALLSAVL